MEWKEWSNLPLTQRDQLPNHPGIYVITDLAEQVWYVGKSANLFNQSVTALRNPDNIIELPTNTYHLPCPDGRLRLHPNDYINYCVPKLQPVDEFLETLL